MTNVEHPILVGVGQVQQRAEDPLEAAEPLELMARAVAAAGEDAEAPGLLARADSIRVAKGLWDYSNPAALLAERFGARRAETALGVISGSTIQTMVSDAARQIAAGEREIVVVAGGEAQHSQRRARAAGLEPIRTVQADSQPDRLFGFEQESVSKEEIEWGFLRPTAVFSLAENALRYARREGIDAHRQRISELWARFSVVAADNPYAWIRDAKSPEEIREPSADNRMIAFPYTKLMTANLVVDQGAAVIVCSPAAARSAGVPEDRWVYLHAATDGPHGRPSTRLDRFDALPALGLTGRRALELADVTIPELDLIDVYSCFPAAVQLACQELAIDPARDLTVTGGLTFAGGPFNSYVLHSLATLVTRLRAEPGSRGLATSLGGFLAKHAFGVYSTAPPAHGFRYANCAEELARLPEREIREDFEGPVTIETYALPYRAGAPDSGLVLARCDDGRRVRARTTDPALLAAMTREELCGRAARIGPDGRLDVL